MKTTSYTIKHHYQPTNNTCGYAALATFLSYYGESVQPENLVKSVPQPKDKAGKPTGSITAQLVEWCQTRGFNSHMYAFDCMILDLSWQNMTEDKIMERLQKVRDKRHVQGLGEKYWSTIYVDAYIAMLKAGAKLTIKPHVTTTLMYQLLLNGPIYVNICSTLSNARGRVRQIGLRKSVVDDVKGNVATHSIVVYGNDNKGNFLVSDPWDGIITLDPETMLCAITAAQIECDNQIFIFE